MKITLDDFRCNDLLYAIAKTNIDLAIEISMEFGGQELYIIKWDTIQGRRDRAIRNAYIVSQKKKLVGNNTLAKELNMSATTLRKIYQSSK